MRQPTPLTTATSTATRIVSLDVMRGWIMLLLAGEACHVYESLHHMEWRGLAGGLIEQFFHHTWNGLRFWDLVQPAFMTMAGAALFISFRLKQNKGISWEENFKHIAIRCFKLFLFGTGLHCVYAGKLVWELWNVLTQLSITTIIAYLIIRQSARFQLIFSLLLLVLTEILYRFVLMPGYDQPFTSGHNFGNWMDTVLMGKINSDGWVAINIIPTAAHTIWGMLAGKWLMESKGHGEKIKWLVIAGVVGLVIGYGLDVAQITPIIKRISTSSFVLASGGWVLLMMALFYWIVDVKQWNRYTWIFVVIGMNSIFIYLFFETVGVQWLNGVVAIFVGGITDLLGAAPNWQAFFSAFTTLFIEWGICYWLYKKKIFFKL